MMKKRIFLISIFILVQHFCLAQDLRRWDSKIDSLQSILNESPTDSVKLQTARELMDQLISKAWTTTNTGQFAVAYESFGSAFEFLEDPETVLLFTDDDKNVGLKKSYWSTLANLNFNYGHLMGVTGNTEERQFYYQKAFQIANDWDDITDMVYALSGMALIHLKNNEIDSARIKIEKSMSYPPELYNYEGYPDLAYIDGSIKLESNQFESASIAFLKGIKYALEQDYLVGIAANNLGLSKA